VAASVAHELRNPLSGIKMNVRVLRDQVSGAGVLPADCPGTNIAERQARPPAPASDQREGENFDDSFRVILREIDRMDLYLQELLSLAGNPSGAARSARSAAAVREPVQLAELADSVMSLLEGRCRHAGIEVRREFAAVPAVRADGEQVRQVILNLVINAIEAMPAGGEVRLGLAREAGGPVRFSVTDGGGGVRPPEGADVFDPFVTTKPGSAGLGLHLCRQIVGDHGGKIGYNNLATGAGVWFELPEDQ
jgi:signal transduction histidine kinase